MSIQLHWKNIDVWQALCLDWLSFSDIAFVVYDIRLPSFSFHNVLTLFRPRLLVIVKYYSLTSSALSDNGPEMIKMIIELYD